MHRRKKFVFAVAAAVMVAICFRPIQVTKADDGSLGSQAETGSAMYLRITAYASVPDETSDHPFITASGEHVRDGIVASNLLPFGSKIQIPALFGTKVFTVEDRTSPRFARTIDIWMATKQKAVVFGLNHATIIVLSTSTPSTTEGAVADNLN